jgi:hypothetical protein
VLVKEVRKNWSTGACEVLFYLLVPQHCYSSAPRAICPGRWIISEHNHEEINCQFQSSTYNSVSHQNWHLKPSTAWAVEHVLIV